MLQYLKNKFINYINKEILKVELTEDLKMALLDEGQRLIDLGNLIYSKAFQAGVDSVPVGGGGGISQEQLDAAVLAAVEAEKANSAAALEAEKLNSKAAVYAVHAKFKAWFDSQVVPDAESFNALFPVEG